MSISFGKIYKPRNPKGTGFYSILSEHYDTFLETYNSRFREKYGYFRPVISEAVRKYLDCGILSKGFARVKCADCGEEYLLAFSCKMRYFCPSCHQKRLLILGEFLKKCVLAPVGHRQIVFTIPKMLRPYFMYDRKLLGKLSRCAYDTLKDLYRKTLKVNNVCPGVVMSIQTFGDLVNFHPHLHAVATEGSFDAEGNFLSVPRIPPNVIQDLFEHKVFTMLRKEGKITEKTIRLIRSWRYSGFNVDNHVFIKADNAEGLEGLVQYVARAPLSQEKMILDKAGDKVIYRSKLNPSLKRNFQVFDPPEWIAAITSHIPDKGQQMIRYYGYYSNKNRGKRKKEEAEKAAIGDKSNPKALNIIEEPTNTPKEYRRLWAQLILKVYEVDPLVCEKCGGEMRIVSFITVQDVIDKILSHIGIKEEHAHSPPKKESRFLDVELTSEPYYDDMQINEIT